MCVYYIQWRTFSFLFVDSSMDAQCSSLWPRNRVPTGRTNGLSGLIKDHKELGGCNGGVVPVKVGE